MPDLGHLHATKMHAAGSMPEISQMKEARNTTRRKMMEQTENKGKEEHQELK
jgi:hypothetical protein